MKNLTIVRAAVAVGVLSVSAVAEAHPGHGGFLSGMIHPWTGVDHLVAMVVVGLWAARLESAKRFWLPAVFLLAALAGAWGAPWLSGTSFADAGIFITLVAMGVGLMLATVPSLRASLVLMAAAGVCHGIAHASEIALTRGIPAFVSGMLLSTMMLHLAGLLLGEVTKRFSPRAARLWSIPVLASSISALV